MARLTSGGGGGLRKWPGLLLGGVNKFLGLIMVIVPTTHKYLQTAWFGYSKDN